jgi:hypothetical protein
MFPKYFLFDLLHSYNLAKQASVAAALDNYIKETYSEQPRYQQKVRQLINLHKTKSLVKKASILGLPDRLQKGTIKTSSSVGPVIIDSPIVPSQAPYASPWSAAVRRPFGQGRGISLVLGLIAGLAFGKHMSNKAYERGKVDALKDLSQDKLKTLLESAENNK